MTLKPNLNLNLNLNLILILVLAASLPPTISHAGSCCGGGSSVALIVPKNATAVADLSFDAELYHGFWNQNGRYTPDPPGSDLKQYRANLGFARRFLKDWQASITVPYLWNDNSYSGTSSQTSGLGDITAALWYDLFEDRTSWKVRSVSDLVPSVSLGFSLMLPTGYSPYDDLGSSFDVTGRGFYRLDGNLLVEKTINPWTATLAASYGHYFERTIDREYGKYVEPYRKDLGDRTSASLALGRLFVLGSGGDTVTATVSYAFLDEGDVSYNGVANRASGFQKQSVGGALAYACTDRNWSVRAGWNHAIRETGFGENFPTTDIYSVGVRYVFR